MLFILRVVQNINQAFSAVVWKFETSTKRNTKFVD